MRVVRRALGALLVLLAPLAAGAGTALRVDRVESSSVVVLDDGHRVRLAGLLTPVDSGAPAPALRERARACAAAVAGGRTVALEPASPDWDRHGRLVASLRDVADGGLVQSRLVAAGCARVAGDRLAPGLLAGLLADESRARRARRGIWTNGNLAVVPAGRAAATIGRFAVVSGVVRRAERHGSLLYLDFGQDWRTDFTVRLSSAARRALPAALREPASWVRRRLRVRGVVFWSHGPMIEVDTPALIEMLTPTRPP